ncbi:MAG: terminase, partial [Desulfobacteraceae bacterium]
MNSTAQQAEYQFLKAHLSDRLWRLNNLYWIIDPFGQKVKFVMNWAQLRLYETMWFLNIILKARQLGFSTFIDIFILDACLFNSNLSSGIIADRRESAQEIFETKIQFPYDNLPEGIKKKRLPEFESTQRLKFTNGSSIVVGTSMRSGTRQILHVSEHGKICAQYPDKAKELRTGSLNTVATGQIIFIESTAEGKEGDFYDICQAAQNKQKQGAKLTELDFRFHFFAWWQHPGYVLNPEGVLITKEHDEYFELLAKKEGIILSAEQKAWYVKKHEIQKDDMKKEYPSTPGEAFESSLIGAYYASEMAAMRQGGRIGNVLHDPYALVHTAWDLGINGMVIWFFQVVGQE